MCHCVHVIYSGHKGLCCVKSPPAYHGANVSLTDTHMSAGRYRRFTVTFCDDIGDLRRVSGSLTSGEGRQAVMTTLILGARNGIFFTRFSCRFIIGSL